MLDFTTRTPATNDGFPSDAEMDEFLIGKSLNTRKTYRICWNRFKREGYGFDFDSVLAFIQKEVKAGKTIETVRSHLSALRYMFTEAGVEFTGPQRRKLRRYVNEARHNWKNKTGKAVVVKLDEVREVVGALLEENTMQSIRDASIVRLGFQVLARRSELSALDVRDVDFRLGQITFRKSKADQDGQGKTRPLAPETLDLISDYLEMAGHKDGPLFRGIRGRNAKGRVQPDGIGEVIKKRFKQILNLDVTGHSLRRGGATHMARLPGVSVADLAWSGRWNDLSIAVSYCQQAKDSKMVNLV